MAAGFGDVLFRFDKETGLVAFIAIHDTTLGPALGGCRMVVYDSPELAVYDAMRLATGMTYKNALAGINYGGGKSVIMRPPQIKDRSAYFETFGKLIKDLNGRYITAVDSGTSPVDMDHVARETEFVTCTSATGNPSAFTAFGVRRGIEAAVDFRLDRSDLEGLTVAIQGAGHVGYALAKELFNLGAKITISDIDQSALIRCQDEFNANVVTPEKILFQEVDVLAPCALGGVINDRTVDKVQAPIIAGSANNVLADDGASLALVNRNILYAPDFVINAGGVIQAAYKYEQKSDEDINLRIDLIHDQLLEIFEQSNAESIGTDVIGIKLAQKTIQNAPPR